MHIYNRFNPVVFSVVPEYAKVLDIGCDTGRLGFNIKRTKKPALLIGIELNKASAERAKKYYDKVYIRNVETMSALPFKKKYFDCIVLADILEHLRNPERIIRMIMPYLSSNGIIIISVPNVAFILNRLNILFGRFNYESKGVLDRSHLRFFTINSISEALEKNGYRILARKGYINTRKSLRFLNYFAFLIPGLFAYQILLVAKPSE